MHTIKQSFNRSALTYDSHAKPQKEIGNNLIKMLSLCTHSNNIMIDLGCGTGYTTEILAQSISHIKLYAIDISTELLLKAKERFKNHNNIIIKNMSYHALDFNGIQFDTIYANLSLHWSNNLKNLFTILFQNTAIHGTLAFTMPLQNNFIEIPANSRNIFSHKDLILSYLTKNHYKILYFKEQYLTYEFNSANEALRSIKNTGTNYLMDPKNSFPKGLKKSHWSSFNKKFLEKKSLTYHIGYYIAIKTHDVI